MGWTNTHLYEIRARDVGWSTPDADADWGNDFLDARKARLGDVLEDLGTKTLKYLYDFGDTTNLQSGSVTTSIPMPTKPSGSPPKSMPSPRNGPASPQANSRDAPNPRPSPEGYDPQQSD